jgi:hypothetical protein
MKTTLIAATLSFLLGIPLVASASENVPGTNSTAVTIDRPAVQQLSGDVRAQKPPVQPQFVGPFELHDGLLPNGLMPNRFNYG